ncbi:SLBB domain-containing protein [Prochlorococcus sp. MIT 1223]|uniref:SLBB domain-containing protein n=1 Tax=Prochlorococcus sp. MIT 1223 TaxID=3096217 RepID=UPI002A74B5ED|nr:SLBB domain-containing protein [Prochlorococcus sp. MIT 1223]
MAIFLLSADLIGLPLIHSKPAQDSQANNKEIALKRTNKEQGINNNDYLIGPGDSLYLTLYGAKEFNGNYNVMRDGYVRLPLIGNVNLNFSTIDEASYKIKELYKSQLLNPELHLKVSKTRPPRVAIIGEINNPGIYVLGKGESFAKVPTYSGELPTLVDAIQVAGGITDETNLTNVKLIRRLAGNKPEYKEASINLIELLTDGNHVQNPLIYDGDTIKLSKAKYIPDIDRDKALANLSPKTIVVSIIGQVIAPGRIEIPRNTPLSQAILQTGGVIPMKGNKSNVQLIRVNRNGSVSRKKYRMNISRGGSEKYNPILKNGDIINVTTSTLGSITTGANAITEPLSPLVTAISAYRIFTD